MFGRATGEFETREAACDDSSTLGFGDDESEAIKRMRNLHASIAEAHHSTAGVLNRREFGGELGIARIQDFGCGGGGQCKDGGLEERRLDVCLGGSRLQPPSIIV